MRSKAFAWSAKSTAGCSCMSGSLLALWRSAAYAGARGPSTHACHSRSTTGSASVGGSPAVWLWAA
eukprot:10739635-Prorocentrum_lima.AAC.1